MILGEVRVEGSKVGNHYWNRLSDGTEGDLTSDQFLPEEIVVNAHVVISASGCASAPSSAVRASP